MRERLRALGLLLLFLPSVLLCYLLASYGATAWIGRDTPDRARLALVLSQLLGLGWPCVVALGVLKPGAPEVGWPLPSWRVLLLSALLALGLWTPMLAADHLRARWFGDPAQQRHFEDLMAAGWGGLPAVLGVLAVLPALMEELTFRGILQPALSRAWGPLVAVPLTALAFSAFHLNREQYVVTFLLGLAFGWLRWRGGSLWPGILAHAVTNAVTVLTWPLALRLPFPRPGWLAAGLALSAAAAWGLHRLTPREGTRA